MYDSRPSIAPSRPTTEHEEIARKMAGEIAERFSPQEQNEMLKTIHSYIVEQRFGKIKDLREQAEFLEKLLGEIK